MRTHRTGFRLACLNAIVLDFFREDLLLRRFCELRTGNGDEVHTLGRFMLDAWKRAGPGALGWTGATEDTIQEISSEKYLENLVSDPKMEFFVSEENGETTGFAVNRVQDSSTMELGNHRTVKIC